MAAAVAGASNGAFASPATPPPAAALSPATSSVTSSSGDARFAAYPPQPQAQQHQGLIRFDAPRSTELAPVPPVAQLGGAAWASPAAASGAVAALDDDVFLPDLVGGGAVEQLFPYGDFYAGLQDRALELSACYFPNMAEMWGAAASDAKPQGLCNTLT